MCDTTLCSVSVGAFYTLLEYRMATLFFLPPEIVCKKPSNAKFSNYQPHDAPHCLSTLDPTRNIVPVHLILIPPLPDCSGHGGPSSHDSTLTLGAEDGELGHVVSEVAVEKTLLYKGGDGEFDVLRGDGGIAPHETLVGAKLPGGRAGGNGTLEAVLEEGCRGEEVAEVKEGGLSGRGILGRGIREEKDAAGEGAPEVGAEAVGEHEEDAALEEPGLVGGEGFLEEEEIAGADGAAEGLEDGDEGLGLGPGEELGRGEEAEEEVGGDEVGEDKGAVGGEVGGRLEVGAFEAVGGAAKVVVGEVEAAEVVEEGDALGGRVEGEGGRVGGDVGEDLLGEVRFATLRDAWGGLAMTEIKKKQKGRMVGD